MNALDEFADYFKSRKTPIERWYSDGVGRFAFRVSVEGQTFVCAARTTPPNDGTTSIMARVAGKAQTTDALIALRLRDRTLVFDPVAVLGHGDPDEPVEEDRKRRGEKWITLPLRFGCAFDDWYDGVDEPVRFGAIDGYA